MDVVCALAVPLSHGNAMMSLGFMLLVECVWALMYPINRACSQESLDARYKKGIKQPISYSLISSMTYPGGMCP